MASATLVVQALVQFGIAASFAYVGSTIRAQHRTTRAGDVAATAFVVWWWSMSVYLVIQGTLALSGFLGVTYYPYYLGAVVLLVPLLAAAAWGIMTYVLYLFTGRAGIRLVTAGYATLLALAFWLQTFRDARGTVSVGRWTAGVAPPADPTFLNVVYAMFAVPLLLSTLAYMSLLFRVKEREKRYRISLVSGSILAWVAGGFAGASSGNPFAQFVSVTLLGALAAVAIVLAYKPPRPIRAWLDAADDPADTPSGRGTGRRRLAPA